MSGVSCTERNMPGPHPHDGLASRAKIASYLGDRLSGREAAHCIDLLRLRQR